MTKKVSASVLRYLEGKYDIINTEQVSKQVSHKIPYTTGGFGAEFPEYLKEFKEFYKPLTRTFYTQYILKDEYRDNRPNYSIIINYTLYEIQLTPYGEEEVKRRYELHKRNMEKYAKLLD